MSINIGIEDTARKEIAQGLSVVLSDSYILYLKTHGFHWNVTGPMFQTLHTLFETQYNELALAVDEVAERIRALGEFAPGSFKQFTGLANIGEQDGVPEAKDMIKQLLEGNEAVAASARKVIPIAEEANDQASADLMVQRVQAHEKTAWMLRSLLG